MSSCVACPDAISVWGLPILVERRIALPWLVHALYSQLAWHGSTIEQATLLGPLFVPAAMRRELLLLLLSIVLPMMFPPGQNALPNRVESNRVR